MLLLNVVFWSEEMQKRAMRRARERVQLCTMECVSAQNSKYLHTVPPSPLMEWLQSQGERIDGYWASNPTSPAEIAAGKLQRLDEIHEFRELVSLLLLHPILPLSGKEFCHGAHKSMPLLRWREAFKSSIRILELLPPARQDGINGLNTVIVLLKWTNGTAN